MNGQCMEAGSGKMPGGKSGEPICLIQAKGLDGLEFEDWEMREELSHVPRALANPKRGTLASCRWSTITFYKTKLKRRLFLTFSVESMPLFSSKQRTRKRCRQWCFRERGAEWCHIKGKGRVLCQFQAPTRPSRSQVSSAWEHGVLLRDCPNLSRPNTTEQTQQQNHAGPWEWPCLQKLPVAS